MRCFSTSVIRGSVITVFVNKQIYKMCDKIYFDCKVPENEEGNLRDIKEELENKIKAQTITLSDLQKDILFNAIESCDKVDEKLINTNLTKLVNFYLKLHTNSDHLPNTDEEMCVELYKTLIERNNQDQQLIEYLKEEIKQDEKEILEMKKSLEYMKIENDDEREEDINTTATEMLNLKVIHEKTSRKFVELRKDLYNVLDTVYDENMAKLVRKLTEAYFKDGNERYITVNEDEDDMECIAKLYDASLISHDPYDNYRIKIDEIA